MAKDATDGNRAGGDQGHRAYAPRALSQLLPPVTRNAYKRRSPATASLLSDWASIVGPRLAAETSPRRLSGTSLTIACSGPMAMELTHLSGVLIERINTASGKRIVERLRFVQDFTRTTQSSGPTSKELDIVPIEGLPAGELNDALATLRALIKQRRKQSFFEKKDQKTFTSLG